MKISHLIRNPKLIDISIATVIGSLGFFINSMYFSFKYFAMAGNVWAQIWVEPVEHALVIATIPLYLSIGHIYWREKRTRRELEKSNRLKDIFTDIMTHDLLNPATIVKGMTQMALMDEKDPDKKEALQNTLESTERMINMIENASLLAKLESGEKLEFNEEDLGVILKSAASEAARLADEKKTKIKITAEGEFKAPVNPLIYDLFSNLIGNAIKYGPEDSDIVVGIEDDGPNWRISVADNGEGIPDEYKEGIFDRFTRIQKHGVKGTGLGLAIVKRVAELHRGRIWVEDNPGGGSIFYVTLPKH